MYVHSPPTKQTIVQIPSFAEHKGDIQQLREQKFIHFDPLEWTIVVILHNVYPLFT